MTLGSREGIGVDGRRNSSRKPEGCEEEEEDGETGSEDRDTKGDGAESLHPSAAGSPGPPGPVPPGPGTPGPAQPGPGSAPAPLTSAEPAPPSHDQHHFLRSSVRPPSKRIRKDSGGPAGDGPGGARSRGTNPGDHWLISALGSFPGNNVQS